MAMYLARKITGGRTAEIYEISRERLVKLFFPQCSHLAEIEAAACHHAISVGLPAPTPLARVEIRGRVGLVVERVHGASLAARMKTRPWEIRRHMNSLAALHARLHSAPGGLLPSQREWTEHRIRIARAPEDLRETALAALTRLSEGDRLCHGDFHPGNILVSAGRWTVIDWPNATAGSPEGDVALSSLLLTCAAPLEAPVSSRLYRWVRPRLNRLYLSEYQRIRPLDMVRVARWIPIVAVARLADGIPEEREEMVSLARAAFAAVA
jgi:aminoglycoside phosphotransferase (APT) family kinase protein